MSTEQHSSVPGAVVVKILDKDYQVSCPPSEQDALLKSARYLDESMRKIKARGNIHGLEKISVMAALNIAHEMLTKTQQLNESKHVGMQQVKYLEDKIDRCLTASRQIDIP